MLDQKPDVPPFEVRTRHRHAWHWKQTVSHTEWVYFDIYSKLQAPQGQDSIDRTRRDLTHSERTYFIMSGQ